MYVYTHIIYTDIYTHGRTCKHANISICIDRDIHTYTCRETHTYVNIDTHTHPWTAVISHYIHSKTILNLLCEE